MRVGVLAVVLIAALSSGHGGMAACPTSRAAVCAVNLDMVPQVSQQIVTSEHSIAPVRQIPNYDKKNPYTGPTVGLSPTVRKTPTLGYRWAIN